MEELSLRNNKGSLLFQKRQRRVQRFTFEFAASPRMVSSSHWASKGTEAQRGPVVRLKPIKEPDEDIWPLGSPSSSSSSWKGCDVPIRLSP